ncbi:pseudouridine synthase [Tianweitania sediminis]|uniref:Pseudouridine synthase n=1 Tax=Tianweitania sediminis TaxID=1502156 RepID=A0A8J7QXJ8_9HYPH|nr:pseudouridine synthase [Tianweitania sediminis]MBP0438623.1 pseudouridine synthase [Tianweitania sediminis]
MDDDRKKPFRPGKRPAAGGGFGDKRPRDNAEGGERRSFGDNKPFGDKKAFGDKKPFGDRKPFGGGKKPFGDRPPRDRDGGEARATRREPEAENPTSGERIAKRLARAGISSRRDAEALIADGRIKVNGVVLDTPARNVTANDRIELDGKPIPEIERTRLFLFHKPAGVVTTNKDPEGRRTIFDVLPADLPRLVTVGRLDINTEGLLLLTNDGGLARVLELPATGWLRRYRVRVHGTVDEAKLAELKNGIAVDGVFYGSIEATLDREQGSNAWLTVGLREGKNREVKNVMGALGLEVSRLIRVSYGPFQIGELAEGAVHELKGRYLRDQLGDRLIEESGAVFDLPARDAPAPARSEEPSRERRSEGAPNRKRDRENHRSDMLDRLQTKPQGRFGDKGGFKSAGPRGGKRDEERREATPPRPRGANVWMAPGARPRNAKKVEAEAAERAARDEARAPRSRTPGDRPRQDRAEGDAKPFRARPSGPRRDEAGAEGRSFRPRGERPEGDAKPFRARSAEGKPYAKRERPDGPRAERPAGDRPFRDRKPAGRSFKPRGEGRPRPEGGDGRGPRSDGPKRSGPGGGDRPKGGAPRGGRSADRRR